MLFAWATAVTAGPDQVQMDMVGRYPLPLRWDNVVGEPLWVAGAKPFWTTARHHDAERHETRVHRVRLPPNASVTVWVPANEGLRIDQALGRLHLDDLDVAVSNGSGLYISAAVQADAAGHSLLLPADWPEERLVQIRRPATADTGLEVALFVSRRDALGELAPYRHVIPLGTVARPEPRSASTSASAREPEPESAPPSVSEPPPGLESVAAVAAAVTEPLSALFSPTPAIPDEQATTGTQVWLRANDEATAEPFWLLATRPTLQLRLRGPLRVALEHRLRYPAGETQARQAYRVYAWLDGRPWQALDFVAAQETRRVLWKDRCAETLGRLETGYLELPAGEHDLALGTTQPLYLRLRTQENPDYLLPTLNAPQLTAAQARAMRPLTHGSIWDLSLDQLNRPASRLTVADQEQVALRLGRDNRYRDGGLNAAFALRQAALAHREEPRLSAQAQDLMGLFTFYRSLLPIVKPTPQPPQLAWLRNRRLLALEEQPRELIVANRFSDDLLDTLASAYFLELAPSTELSYQLPPRQQPSILRIAIDASNATNAELLLSYDEEPPRRLRIQAPELAAALFLPGTGEVALTLLGERHGVSTANTLTAPFAAQRLPGPLLTTALVEIPLPARVQRIRLSEASQSLSVALQYRVSRPYQLSESEYLEVAQQLGTMGVYEYLQTQIRQAANSGQSLSQTAESAAVFATSRDAHRELANHWLPLLRLIRTQSQQLAASLGPPSLKIGAQTDTKQASAEAERLERTQEWLSALEQWSRLSASPVASTRAAALLGETRALRQLHEDFLAEQMLRGAFLHDPNPLVQTSAFTQLAEDYKSANDEESLLTLTSMAVARQPEPELLRQLAALLLKQGHLEYALALGLALPPAEQPLPLIAQAAYQLGWWRIFEQAVAQMPDVTERRLWQGYRAQQQGLYPQAADWWRQAGTTGQALAKALESGLAIRERLRDNGQAVRERAIAEWARWQSQHAGAYVWRDASHLISDYAGAVSLYALERDLFSQRFQALPERPVTLRVFGPAKLRIEGRLLHPKTPDQPPVDNWMLLRDGDHIERLAINGDRPTQGLVMVGDTAQQPGRKISLEYTVAPGLHQIEISAWQRPLLVQADIWRPELPLLVLPELTPISVTAALLGLSQSELEKSSAHWRDDWLPVGPYRLPRREAGTAAGLPVRVLDHCTLQPWPLYAPPAALPTLETQTEMLLRLDLGHRAELAWPSPPPTPAEQVRQRLTSLLWEVEQAPETLPQRLPEAEQWVAAQPGISAVEPLLRRLRQRAEWQALPAVAHSAGLRAVESAGWQPESPFLRVRKALSPPVTPDQQVLAGPDQLGLLVTNPALTRLQVQLQMMDVRYALPQSLTAWYRLNEQPAQQITLTPTAPTRTIPIEVPAGQHVLRIGIVAPVANQYLAVAVKEWRGRTAQSVTRQLRRLYQVATPREPIKLPVMGPAWLRIDELRDGRLDSNYQYIGPGLQNLELQPPKGRAEGLYRLHDLRVGDAPRELTPNRLVNRTLEAVPDTPSAVAETPPPSTWVLQDRYALGEQEDGTWSLGTTLNGAVASSDEGGDSADADQYLETLFSYRYYQPWWRNYYQSDALLRFHRRGSPTFGLRNSWQHQTEWPGVSFRLSWEGYAQESEDWAWNSTVRGQIWQVRDIDPKTRHQPSLGFFYRDLQQRSNYDYRPGYVDQDVLSEYKYFHRRGLVLADTLSHRPWLDTLWYASAGLTSDENWNFLAPEHASANVGWKQLLGDWQVEAAYQWTYYFAQEDRDWNRPAAYDTHRLRGGVLWDQAWSGLGRLQLEVALQYDLGKGDYGTWMSVNWFPERGRGYRDFRPGTIDFRDLRERRLPLEFNNRLDAPPGEDQAP